jgi:hypothetical protein
MRENGKKERNQFFEKAIQKVNDILMMICVMRP